MNYFNATRRPAKNALKTPDSVPPLPAKIHSNRKPSITSFFHPEIFLQSEQYLIEVKMSSEAGKGNQKRIWVTEKLFSRKTRDRF